jgi:flagellar hook-associated protein 3 FlgL
MANTFTRLGTANTFDAARQTLQTRQAHLADLQTKLTAGKRVTRPSDDPTAAAQAERAQNRIARITVEQRALEVQKSAITLGESTLGSATDLLQQFRDLLVQAGNGANSPIERETIAKQLISIRDELLTQANRQDANGMPLFHGLGSIAKPFEISADGVLPDPDYSFEGLAGQVGASDVAIPGTLDGRATWMDVPESNGVFKVSLGAANTGKAYADVGVIKNAPLMGTEGTDYTLTFQVDATTGETTYDAVNNTTGAVVTGQPYKAGQTITLGGISVVVKGEPANGDQLEIDAADPNTRPSIFGVLDQAIAGMFEPGSSTKGATSDNAHFNHQLAISIAQVDTSLERIGAMRGRAGDLLARADRITDTQEERSVQAETDRSRAEDMDMIQGLSDFQNQQTSYQVALQTYASIQKLSLFDFIR